MAKKKQAEVVSNGGPGLYSLTFGDAKTTPAELYVGLPGGAKVYMNKYYQGESGGDGWPYVELTLSADDAERCAREYAMHGLLLQEIEASALTPHPLATPQAPE